VGVFAPLLIFTTSLFIQKVLVIFFFHVQLKFLYVHYYFINFTEKRKLKKLALYKKIVVILYRSLNATGSAEEQPVRDKRNQAFGVAALPGYRPNFSN
jgi:Trk-type K+ transport system membrane component